MEHWDFAPERMVPRTKPPQSQTNLSLNGWNFSARPRVPFQKTFTVKVQGMRWYLKDSGQYDYSSNPKFNAHRLERFYQEHGTWKAFLYPHPHLGQIEVRFSQPLEVPEAIPNSAGLIEGFDVVLVENNPGYDQWQA